MKCRHCDTTLTIDFLNLGHAPPSNAYLDADRLTKPEIYYPLRIRVCDYCWLVQTEDYAQADALFTSEYAYFSSTSTGWMSHAEKFARNIVRELDLGRLSQVTEIASNDGYLLRHFVAAGIPCLGIEPTDSTAAEAEKLGIPVLREFFGEAVGKRLASKGKLADLIVGNNVYAHVPDINDFTRGLSAALKQGGTITLEFPHLMQMIAHSQFDTVYHEHFSYLSLHAVCRIFNSANLRVWRVEELSTHGGSLRVYGCHKGANRQTEKSVERVLREESSRGLQKETTYMHFQSRADKIKNNLLAFLIEQKRDGKLVAAYGAAAKGNTLLNYAGIKPDLLPFVCDAAVAKQGRYMPGSHIPILPPNQLLKTKPDYVLVLPWNIADEVIAQNAILMDMGVRFVTAVPELDIL